LVDYSAATMRKDGIVRWEVVGVLFSFQPSAVPHVNLAHRILSPWVEIGQWRGLAFWGEGGKGGKIKKETGRLPSALEIEKQHEIGPAVVCVVLLSPSEII